MSGFELHLRCGACALLSPTYPFRFDDAAAPQHAVLPVVDREGRRFDVVRLAIGGALTAPELAALAASYSSGSRTICVPHLGDPAPRLEPHVTCPRCAADAVRAAYGAAPSVVPVIDALDLAIEESRALVPGETRAWTLGARARVEARRDDDEDAPSVAWKITRPDGVTAAASQVAAVVTELGDKLARAGSTVEPPRVRKAFTDLVERLPRASERDR